VQDYLKLARESLSREAKTLRADLTRIEKAISLLDNEQTASKPKPKARKKRNKQTSQRVREQVLAYVRTLDSPQTVTQISEGLNGAVSRAVVGKAISDLVEEKKIRRTGQVPGVKGIRSLYEAVPPPITITH
jgi:hypothetical protein